MEISGVNSSRMCAKPGLGQGQQSILYFYRYNKQEFLSDLILKIQAVVGSGSIEGNKEMMTA